MGLFKKKKTKAQEILENHDIRCAICGRKLEPVHDLEEEVDDGKDDVYNFCPDCWPKAAEWVLRKEGKK